MKANPIKAPSTLGTDWMSGALPGLLLGGAGIMALAYGMGLFGKDKKKMTKLEKACIAFVEAICERVQELEKQKADLEERLVEADRKLGDEKLDAKKKLGIEISRTEEATKQLDIADARIRELEAKVTELEGKPTKKRHKGPR